MDANDKPLKILVWRYVEVKTPPFSQKARRDAGKLLRRLQQGENLGEPDSKPMKSIGRHCHELLIPDADNDWRIVYRIDDNAIVIVEVFKKTTNKTPNGVIKNCKRRLREYDSIIQE